MDNALFEKHGLRPVEKLAETRQVEMWRMIQPAISRSVLVHILKPELTNNPDSVAYIFSVIRAISNVNGPALADIYTILDEPDIKAVVTEYVEGLTLEAAVAALGPLSVKQVVRTGSAVAESLAALWNTSHIVHGGVRAGFITLDAGSTAKLISPCFARVAAADEAVPVADMYDLGNLLYFLATGVQPGGATSVVMPPAFLRILQRLTSDNVMTRYASWENVMLDLRTLDAAPAAPAPSAPAPAATDEGGIRVVGAAPAAGGRRRLTLRAAPSAAGAAPAVSPHPSSIRPAPHAVRIAAAPAAGGGHAAIAERNSLEAIRKAATEKTARAADEPSYFLRGLMCVLLLFFLTGLLVYRVASLEPRTPAEDRAVRLAPAEEGQQDGNVDLVPTAGPLSTEQPVPTEQAAAPAAPTEPATTPAAVDQVPAAAPQPAVASTEKPSAQPPFGRLVEDKPQPAAAPNPEAAMNRYLAAHVGEGIPFLYKGQQRTVTLVSYDEQTVTIKTKKTLTLPRASLSDEQRALWK